MSPNDGVIVLMYHRVGLARNAWEARYAISPGRFEAHMLALARNGLHAVSVESLSDWLDGGAPLAILLIGVLDARIEPGRRDLSAARCRRNTRHAAARRELPVA